MKVLLLPFLMAFLFFACTSTNVQKSMDSWVGASKQQLLMQLGAPTQTTTDGAGGEIVVYARRVYHQNYGGVPPTDYWEYKMFYINTSDKIYHWMVKRNSNPPNRVDVRLL